MQVLKTFLTVTLSLLIFLPLLGYTAADQAAATAQISRDDPITLTLEDAIDLALKRNRTLRRAETGRQNRRLSLEALRSEFELKIMPSSSAGSSREDVSDRQFSLGLSLAKKFETGVSTSIPPGLGYSDREYSNDITLSLEVSLLRGLRARAKITSHFQRPSIPLSGVAKTRNMPDIP